MPLPQGTRHPVSQIAWPPSLTRIPRPDAWPGPLSGCTEASRRQSDPQMHGSGGSGPLHDELDHGSVQFLLGRVRSVVISCCALGLGDGHGGEGMQHGEVTPQPCIPHALPAREKDGHRVCFS